jgi:hypothetical protein
MTPNTQTLSGLSSSKPAPVDRVKRLAATLLSERGEASARRSRANTRIYDASR